MKVGILINDISGLGGTERMTVLLANLLLRSGVQVTIFTLSMAGDRPFFPLQPEIPVVELGRPSRLKMADRYIGPNLRLPSKLAELQISHLLVSDTQLVTSTLLPRLISKCQMIAWEHFNSRTESRLGSRWFGRRLAARYFDAVVVLTDQDRRSWQAKYVCRAAIRVIRNPSPLPPRDPSERLAVKSSKTVVGVGRLTRQKGFDLLILAWNQIVVSQRSNWKLVLVGPRGSAQPELEALCERLGLTGQVVFHGPTDDMAGVYDQADIYALSSRYEGFSLTLVEAMSRGLPVVAFDCPAGPGEILEMGKHGIVIPAENVALMAQSLQNLMQDDDLRATSARKAYQRSLDYRPESVIGDWLKLLAS